MCVYLVVRFFFLFAFFFFFFFLNMSLWVKQIMSREVTYRSSSIFQRSSVSFFGFSGIHSSRVGVFSEVVGEINSVATETEIEVG